MKVYARPGKPLREHLKNVADIVRTYANSIPFNFPEGKIIPDIAYIIGLFHDIGKATPFFQEYLKEKDPEQKARLRNKPETRHSLLSAVATYYAVEEYLRQINFTTEFTPFLPIASFIAVRRHHTNMQSVTEDLRLDNIDILRKQVETLYNEYLSFLPFWDKIYNNHLRGLPKSFPLRKNYLTPWLQHNKGYLPYLIQHLIYSLLLDADKHEATVGKFSDRASLQANVVEIYRKQKGFDDSKKEIDILRNEIYKIGIERVEELDIYQKHIFSLTAPTGSGKTLTALSFALRLRNRIMNESNYCPRIIYCLPYLSIIEQNAQVIEEALQVAVGEKPTSNLLLTHHHLSDYVYTTNDTEFETDESEILIEGWDSEIIITTFVQLFHTLFSNRNRAVRKFHKIAGSIVILDEIQSFPSKYWLLFKETAEAMGKYLNTYFILSTATQPAIFEKPEEILKEKNKYFSLFKRTQIRVNIGVSKTIPEFAEEFIKNIVKTSKSFLVVLNIVRAAENFFKIVRDPLRRTGYETYFLSSSVVPYERIRRINKIKESSNKKVVVSTQIIEAGVDVDFDKVIRDLGPMDSINQVAGRSNRNMKSNLGEVEIVLLKEENQERLFHSYIYDPVLIDNTKRIIESKYVIEEEKFLRLIDKYYREVLRTISIDTSREYLSALKILDYDKIGEFELIVDKGEKVDIFVELNSEATATWEEYQLISRISDPIKRKQRFKQIRGRFYQFVISLLASKAKENLPPEISGIRFISKDQLEEFYDLETGFKTKDNVII